MQHNELIQKLSQEQQTFAVATVIRVKGSASAKPGSKAIISAEGKNLLGWVGGGCAESFVCRQAVEAIAEKKPRIVEADLDDEVFGLGMPCGGVMDVYIEPMSPRARFLLQGFEEVASQLAFICDLVGMDVHVYHELARSENFPKAQLHRPQVHRADSMSQFYPVALSLVEAQFQVDVSAQDYIMPRHFPEHMTREEVAMLLGGMVLSAQNKSEPSSLRDKKMLSTSHIESALAPAHMNELKPIEILILGHSRITEELARLCCMLKWSVRVCAPGASVGEYHQDVCIEHESVDYESVEIKPQSIVMVAAHHKGDHIAIERSLKAAAQYIGMIASPKRAGLVFEYLQERGLTRAELQKVFTPAGLDLRAQSPVEIALSIVCEMILVHRLCISLNLNLFREEESVGSTRVFSTNLT